MCREIERECECREVESVVREIVCREIGRERVQRDSHREIERVFVEGREIKRDCMCREIE